jgi:chloramphenicol 3-O-phosphotransferase
MNPIFLVMGSPACGKSTVCRALMQRFARGLHIPVDDLRHMVVSGLDDMGETINDETQRQLQLAHETAARMACAYADAGFAVAIDDFWFGDVPDADYAPIIGTRLQRILLLPRQEIALERLHARDKAEGDFKPILELGIRFVYDAVKNHPRTGWQVVDSSQLSVEQTVNRILELTGIQP